MKKANQIPIELLFFISALIVLYFLDVSKQHNSLCPIHSLGFDFCPGCGLGRSLHHFMHGSFRTSWETHPLGIFAFFVIIYRISCLTLKLLKTP